MQESNGLRERVSPPMLLALLKEEFLAQHQSPNLSPRLRCV